MPMPEMLLEDYIRSRIIEDDKDGFAMFSGNMARAIADYIENSRQKVEVVRCKNCLHRKTPDCPLYEIIVIDDGWMEERHYRKIDHTDDDGFCNKGVPTNG